MPPARNPAPRPAPSHSSPPSAPLGGTSSRRARAHGLFVALLPAVNRSDLVVPHIPSSFLSHAHARSRGPVERTTLPAKELNPPCSINSHPISFTYRHYRPALHTPYSPC